MPHHTGGLLGLRKCFRFLTVEYRAGYSASLCAGAKDLATSDFFPLALEPPALDSALPTFSFLSDTVKISGGVIQVQDQMGLG